MFEPVARSRHNAVVTAAFMVVVTIGVGLLMLPAPRGPLVAALYPPWWTSAAAFAAATSVAPVLEVGARPYVFLVLARSAADRRRLSASGAVLIDPQALRACGVFGVEPRVQDAR